MHKEGISGMVHIEDIAGEPCVATNGDTHIDASRQLLETEVIHGSRCDKRLLRVVQHMRRSVHAQMVIGRVDTESLLA